MTVEPHGPLGIGQTAPGHHACDLATAEKPFFVVVVIVVVVSMAASAESSFQFAPSPFTQSRKRIHECCLTHIRTAIGSTKICPKALFFS
jgi:hypothetical protein